MDGWTLEPRQVVRSRRAAFKQRFGLTDVYPGWVSSAFFWSCALLQVPFGRVVDRYGVKRLYAICFAFWCAIDLVGSLSGLVVLRLVIGAAEAVMMPASWR